MSTQEPAKGVRAKWRALRARYTRTRDPRERARIREQAAALLPPAEVPADPADGRYTELLPRMLAGTLAPGSAEYVEFMDLVTRGAERRQEFEDLQAALTAGYAARPEATAPQRFPTYDFAFLGPPAAARDAGATHAAVIWTAPIDHALEIVVAPESTLLRFRFSARR